MKTNNKFISIVLVLVLAFTMFATTAFAAPAVDADVHEHNEVCTEVESLDGYPTTCMSCGVSSLNPVGAYERNHYNPNCTGSKMCWVASCNNCGAYNYECWSCGIRF